MISLIARKCLSSVGICFVLVVSCYSEGKFEKNPSDVRVGSRTAASSQPFFLETLVDFADDTANADRTLTANDIDAFMAKLAELGIRRVVWSYYGDGHGGLLNPIGYIPEDGHPNQWINRDDTYRELGNPLKVAVEAGHRHGLEVYGYFKPYETGPGVMFPEGSPEGKDWGLLDCIGGKLGWMDPFVRNNPHLRIKRRTDDIPDWAAAATVCAIRLTKKDALPTRITREHIQIWTSANNFRYHPSGVKFVLAESVEAARRDSRDQHGNLLTRKGDPVRVLTLSGLNLEDKYILVTTDYGDGTADFVNSGLAIMIAQDAQGREIPGDFASGGAIWCEDLVDFRNGGLMFDYGFGAAPVALDAVNTNGKQGFIAFARGRNGYLPGALCETEPEVQRFWLRCLDEMIAAGVDGVDFREEGHSTHTDHPEDYGFNSVVLEKAKSRQGDLLKNVAEVRGEAYTEFLRECKRRLAKAGKRMRYNLQLDFFRPNPPSDRLLAYPANIQFDWQRWLDERLMDGAVIRIFKLPMTAVFDDEIAQEMIARCQTNGIPISVNRYVNQAANNLTAEFQRVKSDGRFNGFIFYETFSYIRFGRQPGQIRTIYPPVLDALNAARETQ